MPRRNAPKDEPEVDDEADEESEDGLDDGDDDEPEDDDDGSEEDDDGDIDSVGDDEDVEEDAEEDDEEVAPLDEPPRRPQTERPPRPRRNDGSSGMGRRSTGPARRPAAAHPREAAMTEEAKTEIAPDVSLWPGTTDAARLVGRHTSTIKLWRTQGRIRAVQDESGCWRHHPEDLAEAIDTPDATDPGSVLASGMSAIVQQGASSSERLLKMTEISTDGLKDTVKLLSEELKRAYARIAELEVKLAELRDKHALTHDADLKHERFIRRLDQKHELEIAGAKETSARLNGLLTIIGPIAASIGARLLGMNAEAIKLESQALGVKPPAPNGAPNGAAHGSVSNGQSPDDDAAPGVPAAAPVSTTALSPLFTPTTDSRLVPIETRITDAMSRLCAALRVLDAPAFAGLRAMMPPNVQAALDDVRNGTSDSAVGAALATLVRVAQNLSDLQFRAVIPIAPAQIAAVLSELREMMRGDDGGGQSSARPI